MNDHKLHFTTVNAITGQPDGVEIVSANDIASTKEQWIQEDENGKLWPLTTPLPEVDFNNPKTKRIIAVTLRNKKTYNTSFCSQEDCEIIESIHLKRKQ